MPPHPIIVDRREKNPLPMPKSLEIWAPGSHPLQPRSQVVQVVTVPKTLPTGDYLHGGSPEGCVIERKASLSELCQNLCNATGRTRFLNELVRMKEFRRPVLLLEGDPQALESYMHRKVPVPGPVIRDLLFRATADFGIWTLMMPTRTIAQRRAAGRWVAALLIQESFLA